jgi:flagellar motor switch protein FliN/FliY
MTNLTDAQIERIIDTCREHLVKLAETFRTTLGCEIRLSAGDPSPVDGAGGLAEFQVPGLAVAMTVGDQGLIVLIPQTLPLPAWYREPDISQNNQLQTLAHELSLLLLPADLQSERYGAIATENLIEAAQNAHAAPAAKMVELAVFHPDGTHEAAFAKILVILPVTAPVPAGETGTAGNGSDSPVADFASEQSDAAPDSDSAPFDEASAAPAASTDDSEDAAWANVAESADAAMRALRILRVPVTVSVRLAERKMPLGAVVALVPGSLVTFNKSCEDLLDLYINNHRYCQGEAIKIGESFGLKISKVGVTEERKERIMYGAAAQYPTAAPSVRGSVPPWIVPCFWSIQIPW